MIASFLLKFTNEMSVIFSTSPMTFLSCGLTNCPPSSQYALYPLYSLGLCEAVITIPAWHFNSRIAKESSGVGRNELKMYTFIPLADITSAAVCANSLLLFLQSYAIAILGCSMLENIFLI